MAHAKIKIHSFLLCPSLNSRNIIDTKVVSVFMKLTLKGGRIDTPNICKKCYGKKNELQTSRDGHRRPHRDDGP